MEYIDHEVHMVLLIVTTSSTTRKNYKTPHSFFALWNCSCNRHCYLADVKIAQFSGISSGLWVTQDTQTEPWESKEKVAPTSHQPLMNTEDVPAARADS